SSRGLGERASDPRRGRRALREDGRGGVSRVVYLIREALSSLRRNALIVVGAILAVFISLSLAFGALVVNELLRLNIAAWHDGTHVVAFLNDEGHDNVPTGAHEILRQEVESWDE